MRCLEADVSDRFVIGPRSGSFAYSGVSGGQALLGPSQSWEQARKPITDDRGR